MKSSRNSLRFATIATLGIVCSACDPVMNSSWNGPPADYRNRPPVVYQPQYGDMVGPTYGGTGQRESQVDRILRENEEWKARQAANQPVVRASSGAPGVGIGYDAIGGIVRDGMNKTPEQIDAETRRMNGINRLGGMMQDTDDFINRQRSSINGGPPVSPFYDNQ